VEYLIVSICLLLAIIIMICRIKRFIKMFYGSDQEDEVWTVRSKNPPGNSISFEEERDDND
jgi:hypothetical protein